MSTCESVDLPLPFGPMSACTSPDETSRSTPCRISRPETPARKPRIVSVLMSGAGSWNADPPQTWVSVPRTGWRVRSWQRHQDVGAVDAHRVDGDGLGGGQALRLAG